MKRQLCTLLSFFILYMSFPLESLALPPVFVNGNNGTIIDTANNLVWLQSGNCLGQTTWANTTAGVNNLASGQCGLTDNSNPGDWRLPTKAELTTLNINDPILYPYQILNASGFSYIQKHEYWSSDDYAGDPNQVWCFNTMGIFNTIDKTFIRFSLPIKPVVPLSNTTPKLNDGIVGTSYNQTLTAKGGTSPYTWGVYSENLPTYLALAPSTGTISGTPSIPGNNSVVISVCDTKSSCINNQYNLMVVSPLQILTSAMPDGYVTVPYSEVVQLDGGKFPYAYTLTGTLPSGLSFDSNTGLFTGTPTKQQQTNFSLQSTDSTYPTAQVQNKSFSFTIGGNPKTMVNKRGFSGLPSAYNDLYTTNDGVIKLKQGNLYDNLIANREITVTLEGGYETSFSSICTQTALQPPLIISAGKIIVNGVVLKSISSQPTISNLSLSPAAAALNQGGGTINISTNIDFVDEGGDITSYTLNLYDQSSNLLSTSTYPINGMTGLTVGNISGLSTINTSSIGDFTYNILVIDSGGLVSNIISGVFSITNTPPVANAGTPQSALIGNRVYLNGSASSDANANALTYSWTFISVPGGSNVTLSNPNIVNPSFIPDAAGSYVLSLIVNDGNVNSVPASVTITATYQSTGLISSYLSTSYQSHITGLNTQIDTIEAQYGASGGYGSGNMAYDILQAKLTHVYNFVTGAVSYVQSIIASYTIDKTAIGTLLEGYRTQDLAWPANASIAGLPANWLVLPSQSLNPAYSTSVNSDYDAAIAQVNAL